MTMARAYRKLDFKGIAEHLGLHLARRYNQRTAFKRESNGTLRLSWANVARESASRIAEITSRSSLHRILQFMLIAFSGYF
jgi:hypothetical protein